MVAPQRIASCRGCSALDISVVHTLCYCTFPANLREDVRVCGRLTPPASQSAFLVGLFRDGAPAEVRALHIEFVGRALGVAAGPGYVAAVDAELEVELTSAISADALLRLEQKRAACANPDTAVGEDGNDEPLCD